MFCITRNRAKIDMLTRASIAGISLRQRLLILTLLPSGIGLLSGCGANLFLELHNAKVKTVQDGRSDRNKRSGGAGISGDSDIQLGRG
jgi:hypothetical protein